MPRRVHLVVDTGVDDALAIVVACLHPDLELTGVTAAAGNVTLAQAVANTRLVLDAAGAGSIPVFGGASRRCDGLAFEQRDVHGSDGLAGAGRLVSSGDADLPGGGGLADATEVPPVSDGSVAEDVTLICLAPMTSLLSLAPRDVVATYARPGEANHAMDPSAAWAVRSGWVVRDVAPSAGLRSWQCGAEPSGLAWLVDRLVVHQRERGAGFGDAEALLSLVGSRDPLADVAGLLGR